MFIIRSGIFYFNNSLSFNIIIFIKLNIYIFNSFSVESPIL